MRDGRGMLALEYLIEPGQREVDDDCAEDQPDGKPCDHAHADVAPFVTFDRLLRHVAVPPKVR